MDKDKIITKFRAFQLDSPGSLFSYWKKNSYTLIEARLPKGGIVVLIDDLKFHNKERIDVLHITSWDDDHCDFDSLTQIMNKLRPNLIQVPSYDPVSETGIACQKLIMKYDDIHQKFVHNVVKYDEKKIKSLAEGKSLGTNNIVYHSLYNVENKNDMSQIRLFRSEGFNVLSLGDCESEEITQNLISDSFIQNEVDVIILPHHGSENSMLTSDFLKSCSPSLSVCSSNYDNEYDHPRPKITQMLSNNNVKSMTTKRGDIIVIQEEGSSQAIAFNFAGNNDKIEEKYPFTTKRHK
jgi:competence protein ComEC